MITRPQLSHQAFGAFGSKVPYRFSISTGIARSENSMVIFPRASRCRTSSNGFPALALVIHLAPSSSSWSTALSDFHLHGANACALSGIGDNWNNILCDVLLHFLQPVFGFIPQTSATSFRYGPASTFSMQAKISESI